MSEFSVHLSNRPGHLATLAEKLAAAGVNIEALAAFSLGELGVVRMMVDDQVTTRAVLKRAGLRYEEHSVIETVLPHRQGELARMTRELADSGVNIDAMYLVNSSPEGLHFAVTVNESADSVR